MKGFTVYYTGYSVQWLLCFVQGVVCIVLLGIIHGVVCSILLGFLEGDICSVLMTILQNVV